MGLGLALFPALGGYVFLLTCNTTRPRMQRVPGYHLVFASALAGVVFYAAAFAGVAGLELGGTQFVKTALAHATIGADLGTAVTAAVLSVILAPVLGVIVNLRDSRETAYRRVAEQEGRLREILLHNGMRANALVETSLRTGKCYVALVQEIVVGQPRESDVLLVPVVSGYRSPDTRELRITTNYSPVFDRLCETGRMRELAIAVPLSEVVSVRPFDLAIWDEFTRASPTEVIGTGDGGEPEP